MVGLPNSKESLEKIYQYVTTNKAPSKISSNELVKMIMQSAQATALADPGSRAERFGKATLLGLNTALALKTGGGRKGGKTVDPYENAVIRIAEKLIKSGDYPDPAEAFRIAKQQVAELYGLTPSSPSPSPSPNDDSDSKKSKTNVDDLIDKYTK